MPRRRAPQHQHETGPSDRAASGPPPRLATPAEIYAELDRYVIGQRRAKRGGLQCNVGCPLKAFVDNRIGRNVRAEQA